MNQFVSAVKIGYLECEDRVNAGQHKARNIRPLNGSFPRTLIAVSGGADSIALMRALSEMLWPPDNKPVKDSLVIAHLNHGLRGTDSDADALWLEQTCRDSNLPFVSEKQELTDQQQATSVGLEELSRKARYEFLIRTAQAHQCTRIAVAHTLDDQAETVLHHIIRGTGISGLQGIPRVRTLAENLYLIRPLLEISREDILHFLQEQNQEYRTDASNADTRFTRNRIRHVLLPLLKAEFNPSVVQALQRLSHQAAEVSTLIADEVEQILVRATLDQNQETWRLNCDQLIDVPDYLIKQCFLKIWQEMHWSRKRMGFKQWQQLLGLIHDDQKIHLPDRIEAERRDRLLILRKMESPT